MAPRLPIPGQDSGNWGTILNDYLSQSHTSDGSLKPSVVDAAQVQDGSIPATKLDGVTQATLTKANAASTTLAGLTDTSGIGAAGDGQALTFSTSSGKWSPSTVAAGNDTRITGAIQSSTATAKGDLLAATASATIARVGIGADGLILIADSTQTAGVRWGVLGNPRPTDQNFAGWAFDPAFAGSNAASIAGVLYMTRVTAAISTSITKLNVYITAASSVSATASQNFLGLYDASLNLLAGTAAGGIDGQLTAAGLVTGTIASTSVTAGTAYYIGFLWNGTAATFTLARDVGNPLVNINLTTTVARFASSGVGRTSLPNPASALGFNSTAPWAAFS